MLYRSWDAYVDSHGPTSEPMLVFHIGCQFGSTWAYVGPCRPMSADIGSDVASPHGCPMLYTSADVGSDVNSTSAADVNRHRPTSDAMLSRSYEAFIDSHRLTSEHMMVSCIGCQVGSTWANVGPCGPMSAYVGPKWRYVGLCRFMSAYVGLGLLAQFGKTECVLICFNNCS